MLYYNFGDYEGFKERFGIVRDENGKLLRKNKILLSFVKNKALFKACKNRWQDISETAINFTELADVENYILHRLEHSSGKYPVELMGINFVSDKYKTDFRYGLPEDDSLGFIRYQNMERDGKVYKMRAGKMFRHLLDSMRESELVSDEAKTYFTEVMKEKWVAYQGKYQMDFYLVVGYDFEYIYNSDNYAGEIHSCMSDCDYYHFYDWVNARAASLRNEEGEILSRCIIFDKVYIYGTGQILHLAERQYSVDDNPIFSRMLIDRLIEGGYIDGYKKIGAGCRDSHAFVRNNGEPINDLLFIDAELDADDVVSYQDSFKYYNPESKRLYNYGDLNDFNLEVTDGVIEGTNYDEYHQRRTFNDVLQCHYDGRWIDVDEGCLYDFVLLDDDYYHVDEVSLCPECDEYYLDHNGRYSKLTGEHYCCECCKEKAESRYREEHDAEQAA